MPSREQTALQVEDRPGPHGGVVRTLRLSRPDRRNALSPELLAALGSAVEEIDRSGEVRVAIVAGQGSAFCSGYDLTEPLAGDPPDAAVAQVMARVRACRVPVLARVHGAAFGAGLELAISCDLRVASTEASFCLPPARLGIAYAPDGLARLAELVGTAPARRLVFTGDVLRAADARAVGIVDQLYEPEELDEAVNRLADALASAAPLAVQAMKRTLNALESRLGTSERTRAEDERRACFGSADAAEGLAAFAERRPPRFQGR